MQIYDCWIKIQYDGYYKYSFNIPVYINYYEMRKNSEVLQFEERQNSEIIVYVENI